MSSGDLALFFYLRFFTAPSLPLAINSGVSAPLDTENYSILV